VYSHLEFEWFFTVPAVHTEQGELIISHWLHYY